MVLLSLAIVAVIGVLLMFPELSGPTVFRVGLRCRGPRLMNGDLRRALRFCVDWSTVLDGRGARS